jgi:hypothetical protein
LRLGSSIRFFCSLIRERGVNGEMEVRAKKGLPER